MTPIIRKTLKLAKKFFKIEKPTERTKLYVLPDGCKITMGPPNHIIAEDEEKTIKSLINRGWSLINTVDNSTCNHSSTMKRVHSFIK